MNRRMRLAASRAAAGIVLEGVETRPTEGDGIADEPSRLLSSDGTAAWRNAFAGASRIQTAGLAPPSGPYGRRPDQRSVVLPDNGCVHGLAEGVSGAGLGVPSVWTGLGAVQGHGRPAMVCGLLAPRPAEVLAAGKVRVRSVPWRVAPASAGPQLCRGLGGHGRLAFRRCRRGTRIRGHGSVGLQRLDGRCD